MFVVHKQQHQLSATYYCLTGAAAAVVLRRCPPPPPPPLQPNYYVSPSAAAAVELRQVVASVKCYILPLNRSAAAAVHLGTCNNKKVYNKAFLQVVASGKCYILPTHAYEAVCVCAVVVAASFSVKLVKKRVVKSPKQNIYICRFVPYILMVVCR